MYRLIIKYKSGKKITNIYENYDLVLVALKNYIILDEVESTHIERI